MLTPLVLGAVALLLAGPVPALAAGRTRLRRTPAAMLLLWQGMALAAVLAAVGAGLAVVTWRIWRPPVTGLDLAVAGLAGLLTVVVAIRLAVSGHRVGTGLRRLRQRHRAQLDVLARLEAGPGLRVLEHEAPVAYCVPGLGHPRIVLSAHLVRRLDQEQLAAVVAHERSHLRSRHDLVLEAFTVLHRAFPRWVSSRAARSEAGLLVEILADRAAVRATSRRALVSALVEVAGAQAPEGTIGAGGDLAARVDLLVDPGTHRLQATLLVVLTALLLVVPTLLVVLPWFSALFPRG